MFTKPVKYIFVGKPHLTKTSVSKKLFKKEEIFETDTLKKDNIYDISKFNLTSNIIIIGGKYYKKWYQKYWIMKKLKRVLKDDNVVIVIKFRGNTKGNIIMGKKRL
jgi:hypothetical protein